MDVGILKTFSKDNDDDDGDVDQMSSGTVNLAVR